MGGSRQRGRKKSSKFADWTAVSSSMTLLKCSPSRASPPRSSASCSIQLGETVEAPIAFFATGPRLRLTCLMNKADAEAIDMAVDCVGRLLGGSVIDAHVIRAGGNNRIVRIDRRGEPPCAVKIYFRHPADRRDRLGTEFGALSFLWRHGVRMTPQPLAMDPDRGIAVYSFTEGTRIAPSEIGPQDISAAVRMLKILHNNIEADGAADFGPASEAFFSLEGLLSNLRDRYMRHLTVENSEPVFEEYQAFRDGPLIRSLNMIVEAARAEAAR